MARWEEICSASRPLILSFPTLYPGLALGALGWELGEPEINQPPCRPSAAIRLIQKAVGIMGDDGGSHGMTWGWEWGQMRLSFIQWADT